MKDDYSPVICISSSQLEAFKNKAAKTKISNQVEQSDNSLIDQVIEIDNKSILKNEVTPNSEVTENEEMDIADKV